MGAAPGKTSATGADDKPSTVIGRITWSVVSMLRVTMPAPGSTSTRSSPTGIKKISAADSARAATAFAVTTDSDRVASLVVPMPATMSPDVSPGSHRRRCSSVPASAITADAATVGRNGPPMAARPSCSSTIVNSGSP